MSRIAQFLLFGCAGACLAVLIVWWTRPGADIAPRVALPAIDPLARAGQSSAERGDFAVPAATTESRAPELIDRDPGAAAADAGAELPYQATLANGEIAVDALAAAASESPSTQRPMTLVSGGHGNRSDGSDGGDGSDGSPGVELERPLGWCFYTSLNDDYASSSAVVWNGSRSVVIGDDSKPAGSPLPPLRINTLWQGVDAVPFRGKRVEISAQVRTAGTALLAVSTATASDLTPGHESLRKLPATHQIVPPSAAANWTRLSVIADVPGDADVLYYFIAHNGSSRLWVDDVRVMETGPDSPVTESARTIGAFSITGMDPSSRLPAPTNLDFESTNRTQGDEPADAVSSECGSIRIG